jgi:hypothetical protein
MAADDGMKLRDVALTLLWRPPPNLRRATNFAVAGSTLGFVVGFYYFRAGNHSWWLCILAALIGDIAGAGVYLALLSAGLLRSNHQTAPP